MEWCGCVSERASAQPPGAVEMEVEGYSGGLELIGRCRGNAIVRHWTLVVRENTALVSRTGANICGNCPHVVDLGHFLYFELMWLHLLIV